MITGCFIGCTTSLITACCCASYMFFVCGARLAFKVAMPPPDYNAQLTRWQRVSGYPNTSSDTGDAGGTSDSSAGWAGGVWPVGAALQSSIVVHLATEVTVLQALAGMLMEQGLLALHRKQMGGFGAGGRAGAFSAVAVTPQVGTPLSKLHTDELLNIGKCRGWGCLRRTRLLQHMEATWPIGTP